MRLENMILVQLRIGELQMTSAALPDGANKLKSTIKCFTFFIISIYVIPEDKCVQVHQDKTEVQF